MDELIKRLRETSIDFGESDHVSVMMIDAASAIEKLQAEADAYRKAMTDEHNKAALLMWKYRWIPVTERFPEENGRYLVLYPLKTKPSVWWHKVYGFAKDLVEVDKYEFNEHKPGFYGYHDEYGYYEDKNVTHWMPLPEPPKEE